MLSGDKATILIVEDSDEDFMATERSLRKAKIGNPIERCCTGEQALDYLFKRDDYINANTPNLILLDLNLPGTDGRDVLEEIKKCPKLKMIPTIVLTTSNNEKDINDCYEHGANSFVQKPVDLDNLISSIGLISDYWLHLVLLPKVDKND